MKIYVCNATYLINHNTNITWYVFGALNQIHNSQLFELYSLYLQKKDFSFLLISQLIT